MTSTERSRQLARIACALASASYFSLAIPGTERLAPRLMNGAIATTVLSFGALFFGRSQRLNKGGSNDH